VSESHRSQQCGGGGCCICLWPSFLDAVEGAPAAREGGDIEESRDRIPGCRSLSVRFQRHGQMAGAAASWSLGRAPTLASRRATAAWCEKGHETMVWGVRRDLGEGCGMGRPCGGSPGHDHVRCNRGHGGGSAPRLWSRACGSVAGRRRAGGCWGMKRAACIEA
jgi:hypothetical protein